VDDVHRWSRSASRGCLTLGVNVHWVKLRYSLAWSYLTRSTAIWNMRFKVLVHLSGQESLYVSTVYWWKFFVV